MALGTYGELQSAIGNWLARPGDPILAPFIPDFIRLAEARINRDLRVRAMEARATTEVVSGFVALPDGFLEMRSFRLETEPVTRLELLPPEQINRPGLGSRPGRPRWYSVAGGEIRLAPAPDGPYVAEMTYWKRFEPLTIAKPTNWLLEHAPDLYLYATLIEATTFIGNDERLPLWNGAYERAVAALQTSDDQGTWSGSLPQVRGDTAPA